jgi:hypothetical protein
MALLYVNRQIVIELNERLHSACGYVLPKESEGNYYTQQDKLAA